MIDMLGLRKPKHLVRLPGFAAGKRYHRTRLTLYLGRKPSLRARTHSPSQGHGLANGVGLLAGGIMGGAAALVACPAIGARKGVKGFAVGLGQGVMAAVGLPVGGAVAGLTQVTRGAVQTPGAIWNSTHGKTWSSKTRRWITYSLPVEMAELEEEAKEMQVRVFL